MVGHVQCLSASYIQCVFTAYFHAVKKVISGSFKCITARGKKSDTSAPGETKHTIKNRMQKTHKIRAKIQNIQILFHTNIKSHGFLLHFHILQRGETAL